MSQSTITLTTLDGQKITRFVDRIHLDPKDEMEEIKWIPNYGPSLFQELMKQVAEQHYMQSYEAFFRTQCVMKDAVC